MLQLGEDDLVAHEVHVLELDSVVLGWHASRSTVTPPSWRTCGSSRR
jgi:hypothetical protein